MELLSNNWAGDTCLPHTTFRTATPFQTIMKGLQCGQRKRFKDVLKDAAFPLTFANL